MTDDRRRTADKFRWLDQVGADHSLTPLCFRLAYAISTYVNRTTGDAWPSQPRLAADCNATDRAIRDAITRLRDRGHMEVTGKGGRGKTSRFRPVIMSAEKRKDTSTLLPAKAEEDFRVIPPKPGRKRLKTRKKMTDKRGSLLPTIPLIEPIEETIEGKSLEMINQTELIQSDFEAWYRQYPRKVGKLKAEKIYAGIIKSKKASADELLVGARRYATERAGQDPTYTRHPTTWLNAGGWLDEPKTQSKFVKPNRADSAIAGMRGYLEEGSHE
jgi:hypothetical protein